MKSRASTRDHLGRFGNTLFAPPELRVDFSQSWFVPRSDCKPCEMHVVGEMKKSVLNQQASTGGADAVLQDAAGARVKR